MNIKKIYLVIIVILFLMLGIFVYQLIYSPLGECPFLDEIVQSAGVFAALLAGVIALAVADPKRKKVNVKIEQSISKNEIGKYPKQDLSDELKVFYKDFSDPVKSYRVEFKITNISGLTFINPTLTFRLPLERQHPHKEGQIYSKCTFNSNLFNSQQELRLLQFADKFILSNSNLPYWNNGDALTIWIRMAIDSKKLDPFQIEISVNCENADGITKNVEVKPRCFIDS